MDTSYARLLNHPCIHDAPNYDDCITEFSKFRQRYVEEVEHIYREIRSEVEGCFSSPSPSLPVIHKTSNNQAEEEPIFGLDELFNLVDYFAGAEQNSRDDSISKGENFSSATPLLKGEAHSMSSAGGAVQLGKRRKAFDEEWDVDRVPEAKKARTVEDHWAGPDLALTINMHHVSGHHGVVSAAIKTLKENDSRSGSVSTEYNNDKNPPTNKPIDIVVLPEEDATTVQQPTTAASLSNEQIELLKTAHEIRYQPEKITDELLAQLTPFIPLLLKEARRDLPTPTTQLTQSFASH